MAKTEKRSSLIYTLVVYSAKPRITLQGSSKSPRQNLISGNSELITARDGTIQSLGTIRFFRVSDGALLLTYNQQTGTTVESVAVSPDGSLFSYGTYDTTVVVARYPF